MRRLNDKLKDVSKEMAYQMERERAFRDTSESNNFLVQWLSIGLTVAIVVIGVLQLYFLRKNLKGLKAA